MGSATHRGKTLKSNKQKPSYLFATVTGLLSSSCCLIQLVLNAFSISCAGFSILDPYRPFFLGLTIGVIMISIRENGLLTRPTLTTLVIAGLLSASPEFLKVYNKGGISSFVWDRTRVDDLEVFELEMAGLSCQACANKVKLQIQKQDGVVGCSMFLDERRAVVRSLPGTFEDDAQLEELVEAAGSRYRGKVVKRYSLPISRARGAEEKFEL